MNNEPIKLHDLEKTGNSAVELREHIRYPISGSWVLDSGSQRYTGVPLNLSLGGILLRADPLPPKETNGTLRLNVDGFGESISAEARIIRSDGTVGAAVFLLGPAALVRCVAWLAHRGSKKSA